MTDTNYFHTTDFSEFNLSQLSQSPNFKVKETRNFSNVKYHENSKPEYSKDEYYKQYCRGVVVNMNTNRVVCVPTAKSIDNTHFKQTFMEYSGTFTIEELIDGTMINMFWNEEDEDWEITTRTIVGADCRWTSSRSFRDLFYDIIESQFDTKEAFFGQYDKKYCFTFVMQHTDNRIVEPVTSNRLYLVDAHEIVYDEDNKLSVNNVYKYEFMLTQSYPHAVHTDTTKRDDISKEDLYTLIMEKVSQKVSDYSKSYKQGVCIRLGNHRFNFKSDNYERYKFVKGNSPNPLYTYLNQRYNGLIKEHLKVFKEDLANYNHYRDKVHIMTQELYDYYCSTFKQKTTSLKDDVPYQLKPLCYELHGKYLEDKKPVHFKMVQEFVNKMVPQRMYFVLKFYFTYKIKDKNEKDPVPKHIHFHDDDTDAVLEEP